MESKQDTSSQTPAQGQKVQSSFIKSNFVNSAIVSQVVYNEMDVFPVRDLDQMEVLQKNINILSDISVRLSFMNREIRYLMKV